MDKPTSCLHWAAQNRELEGGTHLRTYKHINERVIDRAVEAERRSSAGRRVRPATTIRCGVYFVGGPPKAGKVWLAGDLVRGAADPFAAADLAIAELVGESR